MERLNELSDTLRKEGLMAAIALVDKYDMQNFNFSQDEYNNSMSAIIHDIITICNDENFRDVFILLNKISLSFGLNSSLSLEILSFNLRRDIDLSYQIDFFENIPDSIRELPDVQMLGAESYRRLGNIDKSLNIFSALPSKAGWWPYDDIWNSLTYNLGCYLLQKNILFLEHQKSTNWSFPLSNSTHYMVSDLVAGLLAPWRHDPITFKMDIEHILKNCSLPGIDMESQILEFLTNRITDLDENRASVVFQVVASYNNADLIQKILKNRNFIFEKLAVNPCFVFYFDLFQQQFTQFSDVFLEIIELFLQSDAIQRFIKGDWVAFEEGHLPNSRVLALEILSRYHTKWKDISVNYIPFLEKKLDTPKKYSENSQKHLFFGLYGTTENLTLSLKRTFDYIKKDTQIWRDKGNFVSIGISTFNNAKLEIDTTKQYYENPIDFIPEKLNNIMKKFKYSNLSDLQEFLPNTLQVLIKNKRNLDFQNNDIKNIFSEYNFLGGIYLNMLSNDAFLQDIGAAFSQFCGDKSNVEMTNIKTFYCLSGLQELSDAAERSQNANIDKMVFLNLNTTVLEGSLTDLCDQVDHNKILSSKIDEKNISSKEANNYFVGSTYSVSKLFYTIQFIKNIINSYFFGYAYKDKFSSQEIIQTLLYENGCNVTFSSDVKLQNICVDIPWLELREALIKDSFHVEDEDLLRFIRNETKNDIW